MSRVIFFGVPAHGHTNPSLPLVKELVRRGEEVRYYSFPEFREKIIDTGAEYCEYRGFPTLVDNAKLVKSFVFLIGALIYTTKYVVDNLREDIKKFKPDYIIHDSICVWGSYAAKACNIPTVTSVSTFVFSKETTSFKDTINFISRMSLRDLTILIRLTRGNRRITKRLGIEANDFTSNLLNRSPLNICYTIKELQPNSHKLNTNIFKFVGPSINCSQEESVYKSLKAPVVYISLGTILKNEEFLINCAKALNDFKGTVIFSAGSMDIIPKIKKINSKFIAEERVNQLDLLKYTDVFITPGGMNSVHESLLNGVPLCIYPFQQEQKSVANAVTKSGCGVTIKNLKTNTIKIAVQNLLIDKNFKKRCLTLSNKFREKGGYMAAVNEIQKYKREILL